MKPFSTYMNGHVEVIRFECISHLPKCTQRIVSVCLLKAECLVRFVAFLQGEKNIEQMCEMCFGSISIFSFVEMP